MSCLIEQASALGRVLIIWVPAIITAIAAIYIACYIYPLQKEEDRKLKLSEEKRASYKIFFGVSISYFAKLRTAHFDKDTELPDADFASLEAAKSDIALRGGTEAVRACADWAQHLKDYRKYVKLCRNDENSSNKTESARDASYQKANAALIQALMKARDDSQISDGNSASDEDIKRLFLMQALVTD